MASTLPKQFKVVPPGVTVANPNQFMAEIELFGPDGEPWDGGGGGGAPLASPAFSGTPTAPTAPAGTSSIQIATTAFVASTINQVLDGAPGALDTLNELAAAIGDDANFAATVTSALAQRVPTTRTVAGKPLSANVTLVAADVGAVAPTDPRLSDDRTPKIHRHLATEIDGLPAAGGAAVSSVQWDGTQYVVFDGTAWIGPVTSRPVAPMLIVVSPPGAERPAWLGEHDLWYGETPAEEL